MTWYKRVLARIAEILERIKGERYLAVTEVTPAVDDHLKIATIQGHEIYIYCSETIYTLHYRSMFVPDRHKRVFHVHCRCSDDTPQEIKQKFSKERHLPVIGHSFYDSDTLKLRTIESYVDSVLYGANLSRRADY